MPAMPRSTGNLVFRSISRRSSVNINLPLNAGLAGIKVPDSKLAREITELVRDTETPLLFHHSSRVYYWGALAGKRRGLSFDPELLYAGAQHDVDTVWTAIALHTTPGIPKHMHPKTSSRPSTTASSTSRTRRSAM
jgi:hypothetical protein